MKKHSTRLSHKVKTKTSIRYRFVAVTGALAVGVFSLALIYDMLGTAEVSVANNRVNGIETLAEFKFRKEIQFDQNYFLKMLKDISHIVNLLCLNNQFFITKRDLHILKDSEIFTSKLRELKMTNPPSRLI